MAGKSIRSECGGCRARLRLSAGMVGRTVRCPRCRATFIVARQAEEIPVAAAVEPAAPQAPATATAPPPSTARPSELRFFDQWDDANGGGSPADALPTPTIARAHQYRPQQSRAPLIAGGVIALLAAAGGVFAFVFRHQLSAPVAPTPVAAKSAPAPTPPESKAVTPEPPAAAMPRRLLAVSVNQYLFANPTLYGSTRNNVGTWLELVADKWRIPRDQVFLLTDAANNRGATPPIKPIVEATIESYLATSRPQDRVVLLWAGHTAVADGKAYLVPLDGELTNKDTLIPFDWLYDRLKSCKARQKLLIVDTSRYDPGRGTERPAPGPLDPAIAAVLAAPPPGVQVWSACSAKEQSYEYHYAALDGFDIEGSSFLNAFRHAFLQKGVPSTDPAAPIPVDELAERVKELVSRFANGLEKQPQTPFVAGAVPADGPPPDPQEPPAPRAMIPKPSSFARGGLADPALVKAIFDEVRCPPIRATSGDAGPVGDLETIFPFSADALKDYAADYGTVQDLLADPGKYPLRAGVLKAVEVLERHSRGDVLVGASRKQVGLLREEFAGPTSEDVKKSIAREQQEGPAAMFLELEDLVKSLEKLKPLRDAETSRRWQAHYDYVLAMSKARFAYVNEYNFLLGKIRKDELPAIDPKLHKGWRLASVEKMSSPRDVKDQADDARKLFNKLIKEHPGTPWEVLARRDRLTALGLAWQPAAVKE